LRGKRIAESIALETTGPITVSKMEPRGGGGKGGVLSGVARERKRLMGGFGGENIYPRH